MNLSELSKYNKTVAAVVIGVLGWGATVVASAPAHVTSSEWLGLGVALATGLGVYSIANKGKES